MASDSWMGLAFLALVLAAFVLWPMLRKLFGPREVSAYDKLMSLKGTGPFADRRDDRERS